MNDTTLGGDGARGPPRPDYPTALAEDREVECYAPDPEVTPVVTIACNPPLGGLAFCVFTAANLIPRARSNHRWYREKFPD